MTSRKPSMIAAARLGWAKLSYSIFGGRCSSTPRVRRARARAISRVFGRDVTGGDTRCGVRSGCCARPLPSCLHDAHTRNSPLAVPCPAMIRFLPQDARRPRLSQRMSAAQVLRPEVRFGAIPGSAHVRRVDVGGHPDGERLAFTFVAARVDGGFIAADPPKPWSSRRRGGAG